MQEKTELIQMVYRHAFLTEIPRLLKYNLFFLKIIIYTLKKIRKKPLQTRKNTTTSNSSLYALNM